MWLKTQLQEQYKQYYIINYTNAYTNLITINYYHYLHNYLEDFCYSLQSLHKLQWLRNNTNLFILHYLYKGNNYLYVLM